MDIPSGSAGDHLETSIGSQSRVIVAEKNAQTQAYKVLPARGMKIPVAFRYALVVAPLAACSGAPGDAGSSSSADNGDPWTTEAEVRDTANYAATVLAYFESHSERGTFISDHDKKHQTRQGPKVEIAYDIFHAANETGAVVIANGRTESFAHYGELIYDLNRRGYSLYLLDHRGQGYSSRLLDYAQVGDADYQKGYVDEFQDYVDDLSKFVDTVVLPDRAGKSGKLYGLAHSMGGSILTLYAEQQPTTFDAIVLSSPMHQIKESWIKLDFAVLVSLLEPTGYTHGSGPTAGSEPFANNKLTSSEPRYDAKVAVWNGDPATKVGGPTYRWVSESLDADDELRDDAGKIQTPVLLLEAGADQIVAPEGQHAVCDGINSAAAKSGRGDLCKLVVLDGSQHEDLIEVDTIRQRALDLIVEFIAEH
jgi:lysophospholipase